MRILIVALLLASACPGLCQPPASSKQALVKALRDNRIALLDLDKKTFEESLAIITNEWKKQQPDIPFPIATVDYLSTDEPRKDALISLKAKDIPFFIALKYLSEVSRRRLRFQDSGLITMEMAIWIEEDWYPDTHRMDAKLLKTLGLTANSTPQDIIAVYERFGLKLESARMVDGGIEFVGLPQDHQQVSGINHLLSNGFKIVKE